MCADCTEGIVKSYCQKITNLKKTDCGWSVYRGVSSQLWMQYWQIFKGIKSFMCFSKTLDCTYVQAKGKNSALIWLFFYLGKVRFNKN